MKLLFEEYSSTLLQAFICVGIVCFILGTFLNNLMYSNSKVISYELSPINLNNDYLVTKIDQFEVKDSLIQVNEEFEFKKYISAYNSLGEDISSYVTLLKTPDTSKIGTQKLTYILRYNGQTLMLDSKLIVVNESKEIKS